MKRLTLLIVVLSLSAACMVFKKEPIPILKLQYPADLKVIRRADWGWKPLQRTLAQQSIKYITIHHSGIDFPQGKDPVAYIRHLQDWSRKEKNWIDIPYHFMIDLSGNIYEARPINYPGDTNTAYDPRGHALICVMGNYENQKVKPQQLKALIRLSAFLAKRFHVSPDRIKGHKDYAETLCPGKNLYRYLQDGAIRKGVETLLKKDGKR